jgi:hypothetical protein
VPKSDTGEGNRSAVGIEARRRKVVGSRVNLLLTLHPHGFAVRERKR